MEQSEPPEVAQLRAELAATRRELARSEDLRRESRDREAMLTAELQHNVRNMLAIIRSVFSRTADTATSLEDAADHFRGRLDTLARHHAQVARDPGGTVDLEGLVRDELLNFGFSDGERVTIDGPGIDLAHKETGAIALALHELATNSVKFGALSVEDGRLGIRWSRQGEANRPRITLEWAERGVPVVASAPMRTGFGREYIEQALPYQFDATTSFELRPGGLLCRISFPTAASPPPR